MQTKEIDFKGWSHQKFIQCCILAGCDYIKNAKGVAVKTAHSLFEKFHSIQNVLSYLLQRKTNPVDYDYVESFERAYLAFRYQKVWCPVKRQVVSLNNFEFNRDELVENLADKKITTDLSRLAALAGDILERHLLTKHYKLSKLEFLGPFVEPVIAEKLAAGELEPMTHKEFEPVQFSFDPRELTTTQIQNLGFRKIAENLLPKKPKELVPFEPCLVNLTIDFNEDAIGNVDERDKRLSEEAAKDPQQVLFRSLICDIDSRPLKTPSKLIPSPDFKSNKEDASASKQNATNSKARNPSPCGSDSSAGSARDMPNFFMTNSHLPLTKQTYYRGKNYSKKAEPVPSFSKGIKNLSEKFRQDVRRSFVQEKISIKRQMLQGNAVGTHPKANLSNLFSANDENVYDP
jgi:hypothetical protein